MADEKIILYYWGLGGLGAACRLALTHAVGVEGFVDKHFKDFAEFEELRVKYESENPAFNAPAIKFPGCPVLAQSNAILKAIGRRYGLNGTNMGEEDAVDEILYHLLDFHNEYIKLTYTCTKEQHPSYLDDFNKLTLPYYIGALDKRLTMHGMTFLTGKGVTVADFKLWGYLNALTHLKEVGTCAEVVSEYPALVKWAKAMDELPSMKKYLELPISKQKPNGPNANWGAGVL